ncbi:MAG TPA: hypothetical protein VEF76_07170 [Patescibacteria group bacterium]|nr:hypothetical protein [Patescibacteria group bacterium]
MKRSTARACEYFGEHTICETFLARPDIAGLPRADQQKRWEEYQESLEGVFKFLAKTELKIVK